MSDKEKNDKSGEIELNETGEITEGEDTELRAEGDGSRDYRDLYQKYLRLAADFENYKKRLAKEKADVIAYGNEELIKALLNVLDNLERALEHSDTQDDPKPVIEGVKLVQKQFLSLLEKFGVQFVNASRGEEFDPRLHQAIERVESPDVEPGHIISEMLRGYTLKDRLLRPALVSVSKGGKGSRETDPSYEKNNGGGSGDIFDLTNEES